MPTIVSKAIHGLARLTALIGGLVLSALVILTTVSVTGRGLNALAHSDLMTTLAPGLGKALIAAGVGPVNGDFELLEAGIAFAVFAFLPICQISGAHATVDIFTSALGARTQEAIMAFWEVILSALIVLISARLFAGLEDKLRYGETTLMLQFPVWQAYAASFAASVVAAIVAVYCAVARVLGLMGLPSGLGPRTEADH